MLETSEQIPDPVLADSPVPQISQPESPSSDEGILTNEIRGALASTRESSDID